MAMPTREYGHKTREQRLAKLKKGPGVFVYDGKGHDVDYVPTILRTGRKEAMLDAEGAPVVDGSGRQVFQKAGVPVLDDHGKPKLGGPPKIVKKPLDVFDVRGVKFHAGEPIVVDDPSLALKLRCMHVFDEVEPGAVVKVKTASDEKPLDEMTKAELVAAAEAVGVEIPKGANKEEIASLITEAREASAQD